MSVFSKQFDSIVAADLQALVDNSVSETKTLEYKESLPGNSDGDKKEFLADVSSFANASGGYIIFGMKENKGEASDLCGLSLSSADGEILRLEEIIRNGVAPRIPGTGIRGIPLRSSKFAIVLRIPRSWALPHMVTFKNTSRFYSRNSAGKFQLDVDEIRATFALSDTIRERIQSFRTERLSSILAGEAPVLLPEGGKLIFHIVPFTAFDVAKIVDTSDLHDKAAKYEPLRSNGRNHRYNFDGFLTYSPYRDTGNTKSG